MASLALSGLMLLLSGCGFVLPSDVLGFVTTAMPPEDTKIAASVASVSTETGFPTALSGTISGASTGTYQEDILQVFFDPGGAPLAAISRSTFTLEKPVKGTLTSFNLIVLLDPVLMTDASNAPVLDPNGAPIVIGFASASNGSIIAGTGAFEGTTGNLHTDSTFMFTGGDMNLGVADSLLVFDLGDASSP